mmetsp:Transcript_3109/g.8126  ORF Transcript_3109/g.8126 Transcript_3109/m.8126 type:complete len:232 (-) Transcript_3109:16-711(-)
MVRGHCRAPPRCRWLEDLRVFACATDRLGTARAAGEPRGKRMLLAQPLRRGEHRQVHRAGPAAPMHQGLVLGALPPRPGLRRQHHVPYHPARARALPQPWLLRLRPDLRHAQGHLARHAAAEQGPAREQGRLRDLHGQPRRGRKAASGRLHHLLRLQPRGWRLRARACRAQGEHKVHQGLLTNRGRRELPSLRRRRKVHRPHERQVRRQRHHLLVAHELRPGAGDLRRSAH